MTEDQSKYIDKIQKLLNKAERAGTPEEAEAFFEKAAALMQRYAIDDAMIASLDPGVKDEIVQHRIKMTSSYYLGHMQLGFAVGTGFGFKLLQSKMGKYGVVIWIGFKRDVEKAEVILTSLMIQMAQATKQHEREMRMGGGYEFMTAFERFVAKRSFMYGFANGVQSELLEAKRTATVEAKAEQADKGTGMELVLVSRKEELDTFFDNIHKGKARTSNTRHDFGSSNAGYVAGRNANTGGTGVGGGSRGSLGR